MTCKKNSAFSTHTKEGIGWRRGAAVVPWVFDITNIPLFNLFKDREVGCCGWWFRSIAMQLS
jgi:hypothetical protein